MTIGAIPSTLLPVDAARSAASPADTTASMPSFGEALEKVLAAVNTSSDTANTAVGQMLDGSGEMHDAMIALQEADVALQLTVQIRNKLVQAYQEIARMPV